MSNFQWLLDPKKGGKINFRPQIPHVVFFWPFLAFYEKTWHLVSFGKSTWGLEAGFVPIPVLANKDFGPPQNGVAEIFGLKSPMLCFFTPLEKKPGSNPAGRVFCVFEKYKIQKSEFFDFNKILFFSTKISIFLTKISIFLSKFVKICQNLSKIVKIEKTRF